MDWVRFAVFGIQKNSILYRLINFIIILHWIQGLQGAKAAFCLGLSLCMKSMADVRLFLDKRDKKLYNICVIPFVIMYGARAGILIWVIIAL